MNSIFNQGNLVKQEQHVSPSGKYVLTVSSYRTVPGAWNFTEGAVRSKDGNLIASIRRNYHQFPFCWIEAHPKGDFLVCGEDYQGQTVVELRSGSVRSVGSGDPGFGWCWSSYSYHAGIDALIVLGCGWGGPFDFRTFDFSDPIEKGWPKIELPFAVFDYEGHIETHADGTITAYSDYDHDPLFDEIEGVPAEEVQALMERDLQYISTLGPSLQQRLASYLQSSGSVNRKPVLEFLAKEAPDISLPALFRVVESLKADPELGEVAESFLEDAWCQERSESSELPAPGVRLCRNGLRWVPA